MLPAASPARPRVFNSVWEGPIGRCTGYRGRYQSTLSLHGRAGHLSDHWPNRDSGDRVGKPNEGGAR